MKVSLTSVWKLTFGLIVGACLIPALPSGYVRAQDDDDDSSDLPTEPWLTDEEMDKITTFSTPASHQSLGRITADGVSFNFMNHFLLMNQVYDHLRGVQLVTYYDDAGMGGGAAVPNGSAYGSPGANWSTGGLDTAPYGPGYAPAYEQSIYNSDVPIYQGSAGYGNIFRGQMAEYGDPGTLIYSLWGGVTAGGGTAKDHYETAGYDTEQYGGLVGLDLFCSCDCRSGLFYSYQNTKIKGVTEEYTWEYLLNNMMRLTPEDEMIATGKYSALTEEEFFDAYRDTYSVGANYKGVYNANLQSKNHILGIYHQFGDEFTYNIGTIRGGYNRVTSAEKLSEAGVTKFMENLTETQTYDKSTHAAEGTEENPDGWYTPTTPEGIVTQRTTVNENEDFDSLDSKYDVYLAGISFERGANFRLAPFTITPRGQIDYTFLYRTEASGATARGGNYVYKKKDYHSLRTNLGADLSLDLYPGDMRLRGVVRGGWVHEFLNGIYGDTDVEVRSAAIPAYTTTIQGNTMGRDWALIGGEIDWTIVPAFMIFANYDFMKNKYLNQHFGTLGATLMW